MSNEGSVMVRKSMFAAATLAAMLASAPALADVKAGVEAWGRGDYPAAIKAWRTDAIAGDPDAQFNLGQAYKLGRGVPIDLKLAEEWYRKAAAQGHLQAEDNYGLMLFQNGDRQRALPIIEKSANRGEPRAQYVFGTALFNGDLIAKDWPRAYALMTRASSAGLAPASNSLAQMDKFIPLDQRQRGLAISRDMEARAARPQASMSDVGGMPSIPRGPAITPRYESTSMPSAMESVPVPPPAPVYAPVAPRQERVQTAQVPSWGSGAPSALPRPGERRRGRPAAAPQVTPETSTLPPLPEAQSYPYPPSPAYPEPSFPQDSYPPQAEMPPMQDGAGASYPQPGYPAPRATPAQRSYPAPAPRPRPAPAPVVRRPAPAAISGGYRVQLGAFGESGRARALWSSLSGQVAGLKGLQPYLVKAGPITRLQAGPLGSKAAADRLCGQVRAAAQSCMVVSQ